MWETFISPPPMYRNLHGSSNNNYYIMIINFENWSFFHTNHMSAWGYIYILSLHCTYYTPNCLYELLTVCIYELLTVYMYVISYRWWSTCYWSGGGNWYKGSWARRSIFLWQFIYWSSSVARLELHVVVYACKSLH